MAKSRLKGAFKLTAELLAGLVKAIEDEVGRDADIDAISLRSALSVRTRSMIARVIVKKSVPAFPTWKIVKLGIQKTVSEIGAALETGGYRMSNRAREILAMTPLATQPRTLELVMVTVADLGFKDGATTEKIYTRALELGLGLCPAEVGPALRLQYPDQPMDEWLRIGMETIANSYGSPYVFSVDHDEDGRWLYADCAYPRLFWYLKNRWVFVRSKQ